jgi:hypothetical protein
MERLKFWTVLFVLWLCVFFTIERLHEPMNIASFVYVMTAILSAAVLLYPRLSERNQVGLFVASLGLMLILKRALGYPSLGAALPITVTEGLALGITIYLSGRVNFSIQHFQQAALKIASASQAGHAADFDSGQSEIYRDLRRARSYERPLSLMTISPQLSGNERILDALVEEICRKLARKYVHGQVAELLLRATDGCATVVGRDDHLVVSLPEVDPDHAVEILVRMRDIVREQLGIELDVGLAAFPDQELTLRGLLERAEAQMRGQKEEVQRDVVEERGCPVFAGEPGS